MLGERGGGKSKYERGNEKNNSTHEVHLRTNWGYEDSKDEGAESPDLDSVIGSHTIGSCRAPDCNQPTMSKARY